MPPIVGAYERPLSLTMMHEVAAVVVADVVERLPGHAAGEGAVADDGDDVPIALPGHREGARDAVGPAQRARGVRALDDVVLGSPSAAGSPRGRPSDAGCEKSWRPVSSLCTYDWCPVSKTIASRGESNTRWMARVSLDHAEVRAEVAARLRDLGDEEAADLRRELRHLLIGEAIEIAGSVDAVEQCHPSTLRQEAWPIGAPPPPDDWMLPECPLYADAVGTGGMRRARSRIDRALRARGV